MTDNTVMKIEQDSFSLEELSQEVARHLEECGLLDLESKDQRVSAVPDARTTRYYTSIGLLDRPTIEGRQARYKRRHVLQLLAVKGLQALSMPLAQVQSRLYGLSDSELEAVVAAVVSQMAALKESGRQRPRAVIKTWREVVIAPGLKIMIEEGFQMPVDKAVLTRQIEEFLTDFDQ